MTGGEDNDAAEDVPIDDGFSPMTGEDYIAFRLIPLLRKYDTLSPRLYCAVSVFQVCIFLATAVNTGLAMMKHTVYIPAMVSFVGSLNAISDYEMLNQRLTAVNAANATLQNLLIWWDSLSLVDRRLNSSKQYLVETTEAAVTAEFASMVKSAKKSKPPKAGGAAGKDEDKDKEKDKEE